MDRERVEKNSRGENASGASEPVNAQKKPETGRQEEIIRELQEEEAVQRELCDSMRRILGEEQDGQEKEESLQPEKPDLRKQEEEGTEEEKTSAGGQGEKGPGTGSPDMEKPAPMRPEKKTGKGRIQSCS